LADLQSKLINNGAPADMLLVGAIRVRQPTRDANICSVKGSRADQH
jgi:hypothetical protein